ncbi:MAG: 5-(carboxyamino)imidazole ribonucleotide mutase [Spirochaetes bacterium]|nr:MAG: 5-(carboxyamino)imidazole ribonucleotide mutase [Spirochaetota bacterium]RKX76214.1 MAG: 5-(carboxyamino)imidazole ribonucleotide mutase [Spirochaetota bacterium]RKX90180.1 MAG: 5-(carboxyamino)imidazole ribonucleotide mutase [Spirochaetota bacterium]RKX98152.1 MAG: 5-(carboxyamino)imidazole ribonucleotide mutase [Spirochaetota bacterium]
MRVGILFGSRSDVEMMRGAARCLEDFEIPWEAHILSAHRVPEELEHQLELMMERGVKVFICGAGLAAHLPGVVASKTVLPVIGVPLSAKLNGMDALYSMVQMPKPIPVATVGIDNSFNAGMLAVQMLSLGNGDLSRRLVSWREQMKIDFTADNGGGVEL